VCAHPFYAHSRVGLPLAVTLALAFATKRMTEEKLLVRVLGSCETMANASVVCTDKTGTLTQNEMTVVAGSVGIHAKFVRNLTENKERTNADEEDASAGAGPSAKSLPLRKHPKDFSLEQSQLDQVLSPALRDLFNDAICVNSTAFEDKVPDSTELVFVGSKTETALLKFAKELRWPNYKETRDAAEILQMIPFSSERKAMGVVVRLPNGRPRVYWKGASEILTRKCTKHVIIEKDSHVPTFEVQTAPIDDLEMDNISRTIIFYANQTLRTIALCYRDFDSWPPAGARRDAEDEVCYFYCDSTKNRIHPLFFHAGQHRGFVSGFGADRNYGY
jgi:P-type Ca2+ transporter type 2C